MGEEGAGVSSLVAEFEAAAREAATVLARLPPQLASWRPHVRSRSLGDLAEHFVSLLTYARNLATALGYDLGRSTAAWAPHDRSQSTGVPSFSLPDLLQRFNDGTAATSSLLSHLTSEQLSEPWTLSQDGRNVVTFQRSVALQIFLISHLRHHTAQLELSLLLAGV